MKSNLVNPLELNQRMNKTLVLSSRQMGWNGKVKTQPAAIARCLTVEDVIHTVRWTRAQGLPLSVRGGGHDFAGAL